MRQEKKDKHFINKPVYEGGPSALKKFIAAHLKYPKEALNNKTEGTVYLKYTIDYKGKVINSKVISGLGFGCDQEAQRLVGLLKFTVVRPRGIKVKFHKTIQIHFRLPKEKLTEFQYTYIPKNTASENENKESNTEKGNNYSIIIDLD